MTDKHHPKTLRRLCLLGLLLVLTFACLLSPQSKSHAFGTMEQFWACFDSQSTDMSSCRVAFDQCMIDNRGFSTCQDEYEACVWSAWSSWGDCTTSITYPQPEMDNLCTDMEYQRMLCLQQFDNCLNVADPGEDGICYTERDMCLTVACTPPCGSCAP